MTDAKLKSYVDRIERLEEERKAIGGDVRDIYAEAKGNRYNPKALRKIIAMRRQKADPVVDAEVEAYKTALGMAVEMVSNGEVSLRKAAKATGVSKSSIHRALAVPAASHDPETGEINEQSDDCGTESRFLPEGHGRGSAEVGEGDAALHGECRAGLSAERGDIPALQAPLGGVPAASAAVEAPKAPVITDAQALAAMDEAHERLMAMKRERGLVA
jgi:uncharacterized protein (UPF0335 family)